MFLIALTVGCIETNLNQEPKDAEGFDPGDTAVVPPIDTHEDTGPEDTDDTVIVPIPTCDSQTFDAVAVASIADCEGGTPSTPNYELEERWTDGSLGWMISSPVMVNLTDDNGNGRIDDGDVPDVIAAPYTTGIYAMDGADGHRLWSVSSSQIEQSTPAVGDVDFDGIPEVFVQGLYGSFMIRGDDGSTLWEGRAPSNIKTYCGGPGIADFEGDGSVELYFGRLILDAETGTTLYEGSGQGQGTSISGEGPISVTADLDLDGTLELVAGRTIYDNHASVICDSGRNDGFPAVGDFDSDPEGEVLVSGQGAAYLMDDDCSVIWSYSFSGYGGPPAIADVDGDGLPEAIVPYQSGIAVLDVDGNVVWTYSHTSGTLYDGVSAYDFDGDGDWEVVLNTPTEIILFDGPDGDILDTFPNNGVYTCGQEPTMADIDNDGHAEIAFSFGASYGGTGGITVLGDTDGFAAALSVWNQHAYSITNIDNDGQVPASPEINWDSINNFRAGPPISYVYQDQNVFAKIHDVCGDTCDSSEITVWWSLGNNGTGTVTDDLNVEIIGETDTGEVILYTTTWTDDLPAGQQSASVETYISGVPTPLYDLRVEVDGGDSIERSELSECDEEDNEENWGAPICL